MANLGKALFFAGLLISAVGLVLWIAPRIPGLERLGRLPGDIQVTGRNYSFHFPIVTSLVLSVLLSLLLYLIGRFRQ